MALTVLAADEPLTEITVTGSRLVNEGNSLEPDMRVDGEYISSRGLTNVADALNELPGFGTGATPEGNQSNYGPGVSFVNRFGLGSNRTLTLVNGRRMIGSNPATLFGPAGSGTQVDLNFIPSILVDHIDNLAVGGAPVYGADAIAGVVNVKLKTNYQGLRAFTQMGQRESGDMNSDSVGLVGGFNFAGDRGNVTASVQHSQVDGLLAPRVARFADWYSYQANPSAGIVATQPDRSPLNDGRVHGDVPFNTSPDDGIPNAVLIRNQRMAAVTFGGLAFPVGANNLGPPDGRLRCFGATSTEPGRCLQFMPDGQLADYDPGSNFGLTSASGGQGLNPAEYTALMSELQRTSATLSMHFDTEHLRLFGDFFAYEARARELVDQPGYNYTAFGGGSSGPILLPADHPALTPQAQDTLADLGVQSFRLSRAHRDLLVNNARGESSLKQFVIGLEGGFEAAGRHYDWEVHANIGKRDSVYFNNQLDRQHFVNALNVVDVDGRLACSPTPGYANLPDAQGGRVQVGADLPVADPLCVPLDIFGEGRPSPAALAYVASVQRVDDSVRQRVFNANIGSEIAQLRGGPIAFNVGWESRYESGDFSPDDYLRAGRGRSSALQPVRGSYRTQEFFGELRVPLVGEKNARPWLRALTLVGKARRVDNSVNGAFTAWTTGLQWKPVEDLELRGNVTRSLRAPSLLELYSPVSPLFTTVPDPCSATNLASGTRPQVRAANCARFFAEYGLPADGSWQSVASTATVEGTSQGNLDLRNESANAWTAGFVLRPRWVEGLKLAVDWVDIRIDHPITSLSADDLAQACFDNAQYPNHYCRFFTRNSPGSADPGQIRFVQAGYANGEYQSMVGLTVDARLRRQFPRLGDLELGLVYYGLREERRSATGIVTVNSKGQLGSPVNSAQLDLGWEKGPYGARWQTNYVSAQLYNRTFTAESRDVLEVGGDWTHNLSLWRDIGKHATLRLAITNLFDGEPPFPIGLDSFNGNYDFLGRRYSLSATWELDGG